MLFRMGIALKPCPRCAGSARFVSFRYQIKRGYVQCDCCEAQGRHGETAREAAKHWNRASGYWVPQGVCPKCGKADGPSYEGSEAERKGYRQVCRGCGHKGPVGSSLSDAERRWNLEMKLLHEIAGRRPAAGGRDSEEKRPDV